jgi:DNA-binding IclR family transcriptional regulator
LTTKRIPSRHRTVDRVTQIMETAGYRPGITFSELARALDAPPGSVHGLISGLVATGWLYEDSHHFFLGPALYALTLAGGNFHAGLVTHQDLTALHDAAGAATFLGIQVGDHLMYVAEVGSEELAGFAAQTDIRRPMLRTAGGKALLAASPAAAREALLRRCAEDSEAVNEFLVELDDIRRSGIATHARLAGTRFAIGSAVRDRSGDPVASITLVGPARHLEPRKTQLAVLLRSHVHAWERRSAKGESWSGS